MIRVVAIHLQMERAVVLSEAVCSLSFQVNLRSANELPRGTLVVGNIGLDLVLEVFKISITIDTVLVN